MKPFVHRRKYDTTSARYWEYEKRSQDMLVMENSKGEKVLILGFKAIKKFRDFLSKIIENY